MSLEHTEWQDRKVNLIDVPGDPAFQGELRCAAPVVEGALVTVSAVMGVETIGHMKGLSPRATPDRGRQGYISAVIRFPPSHSADDVDLPTADDADDDVAARECQDATTVGTWVLRRHTPPDAA
jgi:hypothetical protein